MKLRHVIALVLGCLLLLPGAGMLIAGGGLGWASATGKDDAGYLTSAVSRLDTSTAAATAEDFGVVTDRATPDWVLRRLDADLRVQVQGGSGPDLFVGVGPADEVAAYLAGVSHDKITGSSGGTVEQRRIGGNSLPADPTRQTFWLTSTSGPTPLTLDWAVTGGHWTVVLMNVDGSPGVSADVTLGGRAGFLVPLAVTLLGLGALFVIGATFLLLAGIGGGTTDRAPSTSPGSIGTTSPPDSRPSTSPTSDADATETDRVEVSR